MATAVDILNSLIQQRENSKQAEADRIERGFNAFNENRQRAVNNRIEQQKLDLQRQEQEQDAPYNNLIRSGKAVDAIMSKYEVGALTPQEKDRLIQEYTQGGLNSRLSAYISDPQTLPPNAQQTPDQQQSSQVPQPGSQPTAVSNFVSNPTQPSANVDESQMSPSERVASREVRKNAVELEKKKSEEQVKVSSDLEKEREKELVEKFGQAGRMIQGFSNLWGYAQTAEEVDVPGGGPGEEIATWLASTKMAPDQLQDFARPLLRYDAQKQEVKISALPILSGQARYVVDLAKAIEKTVPSVGRTLQVKRDLIAQSVRNSMSLVYAVENGFTTREKLREIGIDPNDSVDSVNDQKAQALLNSVILSDQQKQNINEAIDIVLSSEALGDDSKPVKGNGKKISFEDRAKSLGVEVIDG